jgi:excisionase family DNA binding protein
MKIHQPAEMRALFFQKNFKMMCSFGYRRQRTGILFCFWFWVLDRPPALPLNQPLPPTDSLPVDCPTNFPPTLDNLPNLPIIPIMPDELTTAQAAEKLNVSERTIRNMIERGSISAHKLDPQSKSVYRIPLAEIHRILSQRTNKGNQPARKQ